MSLHQCWAVVIGLAVLFVTVTMQVVVGLNLVHVFDLHIRPYNLISGSPVLVPYGYLTGQTVEYQNRNLEILRTEVFFTGTLT